MTIAYTLNDSADMADPSPTFWQALTESITVGTATAGAGIAGWAVFLLSKLRRTLSHDSSDMAVHNAMRETIDTLAAQVKASHAENARLQGYLKSLQREVAKLQAENIRLQSVANDLLGRLMIFSETAATQAAADHSIPQKDPPP